MKWQKMETAPTDGTDILVFDAAREQVLIVFYDDGEWLSVGGEYMRELSHWMPLPDWPED